MINKKVQRQSYGQKIKQKYMIDLQRKNKKQKKDSKPTPEKKKKKEQFDNRPISSRNDKSKSKQKQIKKQYRKKQINADKSKDLTITKLLTNSPLITLTSKSKSHSKNKSKSPSKERSTSRINTNRSNYEKDKSLRKQNKQNNILKTQPSRSKSKSCSRKLKFDSPIRPLTQRERNKKHETTELKKTLKRKIKNIMQQQIPIENQQKVKLKKKVPEIKTQFSNRRGSYFDQQLLKKLQINHQQQKKIDFCPFSQIKSDFQSKYDNQTNEAYSKSEMKTYEETNFESNYKLREMEHLKKQQELKWRIMLLELTNLKHQEKIPDKIDKIIEQLHYNYVSLQERALQILQNSKGFEKPLLSGRKQPTNRKSIEQDSGQQSSQTNKQLFINQPDQRILTFEQQSLEQTDQKQINNVQRLDHTFENENNVQQAILNQKSIKNDQIQPLDEGPTFPIVEQQNSSNFKRTKKISLDEFYVSDIFNKNDQNLFKSQISNLINVKSISKPSQNENFKQLQNFKLVNEDQKNNISDRNLLNELNINQQNQSSIEFISFNRQHFSQFQQQMMEHIRQGNSNNNPNLFNQVKIHHNESIDNSDSMLLNLNPSSQAEQLSKDIQNNLILQFCANILRSKQILHNFLTVYTQMIDKQNEELQQTPVPIPSSNQYALQLITKTLNFIDTEHRQYFMRQIVLAFECRPLDVLRYVRNADELQEQEGSILVNTNSQQILSLPLFNLDLIASLETQYLKNEYYIPNYFSFNHAVYDCFNDVIDDLRPYGSSGKAIFTKQISHPVKSFEKARHQIIHNFKKIIAQNPLQEPEDQLENRDREEGIFETIYLISEYIESQFWKKEIQFLAYFFL